MGWLGSGNTIGEEVGSKVDCRRSSRLTAACQGFLFVEYHFVFSTYYASHLFVNIHNVRHLIFDESPSLYSYLVSPSLSHPGLKEVIFSPMFSLRYKFLLSLRISSQTLIFGPHYVVYLLLRCLFKNVIFFY